MTDHKIVSAEIGAYSSVVGGGVLLVGNCGKGPMLGQIASLCHGDWLRSKAVQERLAVIIADAINEAGISHE